MKRTPASAIFLVAAVAMLAVMVSARQAKHSEPEELNILMQRAMAFELARTDGQVHTGWPWAVFWLGVTEAYKATGNTIFLKHAEHWAKTTDWKISSQHYYADSIPAGQVYLELYTINKDPKRIDDVRKKLDTYFDEPELRLDQINKKGDGVRPWNGHNLWWWADALFMAAPAFAQLYAATDDSDYLAMLDELYWDSAGKLFDKDAGLFYRDAMFLPSRQSSPTGQKIFWSRGNGWVYAGLIRILEYEPEGKSRERFLELYRTMSAAIIKHQNIDGLWRSSINEPMRYPNPETTGSGLFVYGLLTGIRRGYIDRDTYLPPAMKGWQGLQRHLLPDGGLGYTQDVADRPWATRPDIATNFGQGILLMAASALYQLDNPR